MACLAHGVAVGRLVHVAAASGRAAHRDFHDARFEPLERLVAELVRRSDVGAFSLRELTTTLWAVARARIRAPCDALVREALARDWADMSPVMLANFVTGVLDCGASDAAVEAAFRAADRAVRAPRDVPLVARFKPEELAQVAWAFAKAGERAQPARVLDAVVDECRRRGLAALGSADVSKVLWALASARRETRSFQGQVADELLRRGLAAVHERDVVMTLWAATKLSSRLDGVALPESTRLSVVRFARAAAAALARPDVVRRMNDRDVADALWALVTLDETETTAARALFEAAARAVAAAPAAAGVLGDASCAVTIMWGLASAACADARAVRRLTRRVSAALDELDARGLARFAWAVAKLAELLAAEAHDEDATTPAGPAASAPRVLELVAREAARRRLRGFGAADVRLLVWSLACGDALGEPGSLELLSLDPACLEEGPTQDRGRVAAMQWHEVALCWRLVVAARQGGCSSALPSLVQAHAGRWMEPHVAHQHAAGSRSSRPHQEMSHELRDMGLVVEDEVTTHAGVVVDMVVRASGAGGGAASGAARGATSLFVEVDGPSHFLWDGVTPDGPTSMKRRLLAASGVKWASLSVVEWHRLPEDRDGRKARREWLRGRLGV